MKRTPLRGNPEKIAAFVDRGRRNGSLASASKGTIERLICAACGREFDYYVTRSGFLAKTCSPECQRALSKGPKPEAWVRLTCANPVCRKDFTCLRSDAEPRTKPPRRYCCFACKSAHWRESEESRERKRQQMRERQGRDNPNWRNGSRVGARERDGERRWYEGADTVCAGPGDRHAGRVSQHHVVYEQHVRSAGGDRWDRANRMALCDSCHLTHHRRVKGRVLPVTALPASALTFAFDLLGPAAYDYFRRYYDGEDPRLDALLERTAA